MDKEKVEDLFNVFEVITLPSGNQISTERFAKIFSDVEEPSYDEFMKVDDGIKGYKQFFDKCKEEGILN